MKVAICTVDVYAIIISISYFRDLDLEELWMSFGMGTHFHHILVHVIVNSLEAEKSKTMMFQAISRCDTVSSKGILHALHQLLLLLSLVTSASSPRSQNILIHSV